VTTYQEVIAIVNTTAPHFINQTLMDLKVKKDSNAMTVERYLPQIEPQI
jgi:hypothetical protein